MLTLLLSLLSAHAATGLTWTWRSAQPTTYRLETVIESPRGQSWVAEHNAVARSTRAMLRMEVSCVPEPSSTERWAVSCDLTAVDIRGKALPGEEAELERILGESVALLSGKSVRLEMGRRGGIRELDLKGIDTTNSRLAAVIEQSRWMVRRAFAPLDLVLPKSGDDKGKVWRQKGSPMAFELASGRGTAGGVVLKHRVQSVEGERVQIETTGRAAVVDGATMEAGTSSMLRLTATGRSQFNTVLGVLDWAQLGTDSGYAASNLEGLSHLRPPKFSSIVSRVNSEGETLDPTPQ